MDYIYETHLHTYEASACGKAHGCDYISFMKERGYAGIIVTDHFFNGNCRIPRSLPWEERVDGYCSGYEAALAASVDPATANGLSVFFGVEYNFEGDEYLLYGIDKAWLLARPDLLSASRSSLHALMHEAKGLMIQAHPMRERDYLRAIHLAPQDCDGAEVFNAGNPPWQNALAREYILRHGLRMTAGSDIHSLNDARLGGMRFSHRLEDIHDFVESFLAGEGEPVIRMPDGTFLPVDQVAQECHTDHPATLPVIMHSPDTSPAQGQDRS